MLGGLLGAAGNAQVPELASDTALYVMLGMAAMMAAVLQAPLAALVADLELTANPKVILPAMLIIAVATLTVGQLLKQRSVLLTTLATLGVRYPPHPAAQHLMRVGVASLMSRQVVQLPGQPEPAALKSANRRWIVVDIPGGSPLVLNAEDVVAYHEENIATARPDLPAMRSERGGAGIIDVRATLQEALTELNRAGGDALCVTRAAATKSLEDEPTAGVGVLTRADIERQAGW